MGVLHFRGKHRLRGEIRTVLLRSTAVVVPKLVGAWCPECAPKRELRVTPRVRLNDDSEPRIEAGAERRVVINTRTPRNKDVTTEARVQNSVARQYTVWIGTIQEHA